MKSTKSNAVVAPAIDGAFLSMLQAHRRGEALTDLAEAMRQVTEAVQLTGRPGNVTFKVNIRPASKAQGALVVEDDIVTKVPKADRQGSIFFADDHNNLLREDPRQTTLPLRTIDGGKQEEAKPLKQAVGAEA